MAGKTVADVIVVGAGAIGGAIALGLAERGIAVTVLEGGRVGRGASWAAAGVLAPERGGHEAPALSALAADSLALWPDWAAQVEGRSGVGLNLRFDGLLDIWLDPDALHLPPEVATAPPVLPEERAERLTPARVRELEPWLTGPVAGGVFFPGDGQVDNTRLAPALLRAASDLGATVIDATPVAGLIGAGGRCSGVRTTSGAEFHAGAVVLATGAWTAPLAAASGIDLPVEPWRGQMLTFDPPSRVLRHLVFCGELVMIPRPHGPLIVGTTLEKAGYDARVTLAGLDQITARALRVAPGLGDLPLAHAWAGLRPGTPDDLPYLGPVPGWERLHVASGHGRKGIILAPITGALMTRLVLDGEVDPRLLPCLPSRLATGAIREGTRR